MGLIPDEIIREILDRCDIVEVVGSYVSLKKAGRNFKANCPFHNEKTPSFVVNPDKQIFHCFGCDAGGNVIGFLMKHDHLTFPEAVRSLARKVNVTVPETGGMDQTSNVRQQIYKVNREAAQFFHKNLIAGQSREAKAARQYLKQRNVELSTVEQFQLGYAPDAWDGLITHLRGKNVSLNLMEQAGLIIPRDNARGYYDRFRNRITFPIFDSQENCRAFGARAMESASDQKSIGAKYINSPETPVYTKGHHLYGFHLAKRAIAQADSVTIVEGYMDAIMPFQAGVHNLVASLGTALTVDQIRLLRRYTRNVIMLFDTDPAGESAMLRSLDTLIEEGMNVKVAVLTERHDPDSFIREFGVEAFRERIDKAKTLFDYKLGVLTERYDIKAIETKAKISGEMLQTIDKFPNAVIKAEYVKRLARALIVPEQALNTELGKIRQMTGEKKVFGKSSEPHTSVADQIRMVESDMLRLLLEEESFIEATKKELNPSDFQDKKIREVISKIFDLCEQGKEINSAVLINSFADPDMQQMIARLMTGDPMAIANKQKMHSDYMNRMKKDRKKLRMKFLQEQIREAESENDQERLEMLLNEYNLLVKEVIL